MSGGLGGSLRAITVTRPDPVRQFRPGISEGNGAIEDQTSGAAFLIQRKIAQTLELVTQLALGISKTRLAMGLHDFERARIQTRFEVDGGFGFWFRKQPIVQAHLRRDGMLGAYPVDGAFDLSIGVCAAAFAFQISRTAKFQDFTSGILDDLVAPDDVRVF